MTLSTSDIEKLALLARIELDENLKNDVTEKLDNVLGLIDQLQAIDAAGVAPMSNPLDQTQRLREDTVTETDLSEKLQTVAPSTSEGLYLVPQVID